MNPLVSIIIPTYNRAEDLKRALQSVFDQTFTDWEIVVVPIMNGVFNVTLVNVSEACVILVSMVLVVVRVILVGVVTNATNVTHVINQNHKTIFRLVVICVKRDTLVKNAIVVR